MKVFTNSKNQRIEVTDEKLLRCLEEAVSKFNEHDRLVLLEPRKNLNRQYVGPGEKGWGGASERAICHRLAQFLENQLATANIIELNGRVAVDCEYNRHLGGVKTQRISEELLPIIKKARRKYRKISDDPASYVISICPDIVVHERGTDDLNLLAIEVKKNSNPEIAEYDEGKLKSFTRTQGEEPYAYQLGFVVKAIDDIAPADRRLEISKAFSEGQETPLGFAR